MNILVTGSNGQLGSEIRELSSAYSHQFFFTDHLELDICDSKAVQQFFQDHQIDLCINCAAHTAVDKAESEPEKARAINAQGALNLASACASVQAWIIHVSTDFVFDGNHSKPYREDDQAHPLSVYGQTKWEGEELVRIHCPNHIIIRTAWVYSSYGNNFVKTIQRLCRERDKLGIIYDQVGSPTYAADLADAILTIAESPALEASAGTYHYSNEGVASWFDFAIAIRDISGLHTTIDPIRTEAYPTPAIRPAFSLLDKQKIRDTFGIRIPYWRDSLDRCIQKLKSTSS